MTEHGRKSGLQPPPVPNPLVLASSYRLIAELLLNPSVRDPARIEAERETLAFAPASVREPVKAFLASPSADDVDEYTKTLELTPPCPLYLGAYIYDEPKSCRGAGMSGRNGYMIEIGAIYGHFGFALDGRELADFLPAMVEFLALSLEHRDRDTIGIRRRFVEQYVQPGLPPLRKALAKFDSAYGFLIEALQAAVDEDAIAMFDGPVWIPPKEAAKPRQPGDVGPGGPTRGPERNEEMVR